MDRTRDLSSREWNTPQPWWSGLQPDTLTEPPDHVSSYPLSPSGHPANCCPHRPEYNPAGDGEEQEEGTSQREESESGEVQSKTTPARRWNYPRTCPNPSPSPGSSDALLRNSLSAERIVFVLIPHEKYNNLCNCETLTSPLTAARFTPKEVY